MDGQKKKLRYFVYGKKQNVQQFFPKWKCFMWRCGLVVDTWLRDQKVPGSSPGYAWSTLSPWERLFA